MNENMGKIATQQLILLFVLTEISQAVPLIPLWRQLYTVLWKKIGNVIIWVPIVGLLNVSMCLLCLSVKLHDGYVDLENISK